MNSGRSASEPFPVYFLAQGGRRCHEDGGVEVDTREECVHAANALDLNVRAISYDDQFGDLPFGCVAKAKTKGGAAFGELGDNQLIWNWNEDLVGTGSKMCADDPMVRLEENEIGFSRQPPVSGCRSYCECVSSFTGEEREECDYCCKVDWGGLTAMCSAGYVPRCSLQSAELPSAAMAGCRPQR